MHYKSIIKIYSAKYSINGGVIVRDFYLPSERYVRAEIASIGGIILSIKEKKLAWWQREWITTEYKIKLLSSIGYRTQVGHSPENALRMVIESEDILGKRREIQPALDILMGGGSFVNAVEYTNFFDSASISMLKAGAQAGFLKQSISLVLQHIESQRKNWKSLTASIGLLSFDITSSLVSLVSMQFYYFPWLRAQGVENKNPEALKKFNDSITTLSFINGSLLITTILFSIMVIAFIILLFFKKGLIGDIAEKISLRVPVLKSYVYDGTFATNFAILGRMLKSGIPFNIAIDTLSGTSYLYAVKMFWGSVAEKIKAGIPISSAMVSPLMSNIEMLDLRGHQNANQLGDIFLIMSEDRGYKYNRAIGQMNRYIIVSIIAFTVVTALIMLKALMIQNEGFMGSLYTIGGGGF